MTFNLIDVHCHVHGKEFDLDRKDVLTHAKEVGVRFVLAMGEDFEDNQRILDVAKDHPMILPCFGFHPTRVEKDQSDLIEKQIRDNAHKLAAIGEVGLDYWVADTPEFRKKQADIFSKFIVLAKELDLPLSVHSRSAGHYAIDFLKSQNAKRVCLHAFDGSAKHATLAVELGYMLSVPPSVVRSPQKQKVIDRVPLSSLLLETDSPVLGPDRQERNVPSNVIVSATEIASIKGCSLDEILEITSKNAWQFFRLERFSRLASQ